MCTVCVSRCNLSSHSPSEWMCTFTVLFSMFPPSQTFLFFFFNDTPPPEIYPLPLHAAFPIPIKHPPPLLVARSEKGALLVGDEAPSPRNRGSQAGQEVTALPRQFLLLLTATPVQNSLEE